ncbi:MAG: WbuC family cupin fold metalloprotein [Proteobacteria bacterium]|nr:WbuC family cupin fold metalloprotein [Pseudomonadota bacterium]MBU0966652.1 WbuC family cupin fold metalloprotein [Pseudomonadota bacterium]
MKLITSHLFNELLVKAGSNARKRTNHNIHESAADPVQRLFIAARLGSYFRPHRHASKGEFALVMRGLFDVLVFDDDSRLTQRITIGPGANVFAFDLPPNIWHSWIARADESVFFETKQGPYDPQTAAEFAPWSPAEDAPEVNAFFVRLQTAKVGDYVA